MKNILTKIRTFISTHKKTSIVIAIVIIIGGYYTYKKLTTTAGDPTYTLGTVTTGTIVSSITGTGQVSTDHTLDLKPLASANVVFVGVTAGQTVQEGDLVAELDTTDAEKSVRDAEANLTSAQLSLQKLQEPADSLTLLQAQDAVTQANAALATDYDSGYNTVSSAFVDLPTIIAGLDSTLHGTDATATSNGQENISYYTNAAAQIETTAESGKAVAYGADAEQKFQAAEAAYTQNQSDFKNLDRTSDTTEIQSVLDETYTTSNLIADALQSAQNLIQYYQDVQTAQGRTPVVKSTTELTTLTGYTGKLDNDIASLLSSKNNIINDIAAIPEKQASLTQIQDGADPIDVQSTQLDVTKAENALQDAKDTLQDYYVYAPFSGTISAVDVKVGDPASSGTAVATIIADQEVVVIPLNEVDIAKVALGDKSTLTFDAITGLTLTGKVTAMDTVGTVTQGVVNYNVTISLDSTDPRVKPGMSTTASIMTKVDQDVLTVPSSAVKTSAAGSYVQVFSTTPVAASTDDTTSDTTAAAPSKTIVSAVPPTEVPVTVGISDDTNTEIVSGLTAGEQVVTRTTASTATPAKATTAPSLLGGGATGGRGGAAGGAGALRGL